MEATAIRAAGPDALGIGPGAVEGSSPEAAPGPAPALRRAARAALLVLVATWLRAAAGSDGVREVARRSLGRLRRLPAISESAAVLDALGTGGRLAPPARTLLAALRPARKRPVAILDAVLGWVAREAQRFRPTEPRPATRLRLHAPDAALIALAAAPGLVLLGA
jgi:hypothetical protein